MMPSSSRSCDRRMTARRFARSGTSGVLTSPYTRRVVTVVSGSEHGNKVTVTTDDGRSFDVDAAWPVEKA